jgi:hypothetical protein
MEDPVVAADGHSYGSAIAQAPLRLRRLTPQRNNAERSAIARWLLRSQRSPCTNVPMAHGRVLPNHSMRAAIAEWRATAQAPPAEAGAAAP